jgi:hypothetical protein
VSPERSHLLEQAFGHDFLYALVHRLDDQAELPRVYEAEPLRPGANGEVNAERMNVEGEAARP